MVEHDKTVVKAGVAIGQFEVVDGTAREFRLDEILQIITPVAEATAERERQINLVEQFVARHEGVEHVPRIAVLGLDRSADFSPLHLTTGGGKRNKFRAPFR